MTEDAMDFAEFETTIRTMVEEVRVELEPDEDFDPVVFIFHGNGLQIMHAGDMFLDERRKRVFAAKVLPEAIKHFDATMFAQVNTRWHMKIDDPAEATQFNEWWEANPEASIGDYPYKEPSEDVSIFYGHKDGTIVMLTAALARNADAPPTLGPWDRFEGSWFDKNTETDEPVFAGRMITYPMAALTGTNLVSDESFASIAHATAHSERVREMICEAWLSQGLDPDVAMDQFMAADDDERQRLAAETEERLREMFPEEWTGTLQSIAGEHRRDAGDEYLERYPGPEDGGGALMVGSDEIVPMVFPAVPDTLPDE